ncbi:acyltransferase [Microbacterium horticulturae]|uniref:Acyltransferase n=1 Tax=Microbacterium horticulturae TaxID=3028316 RepID=A0ABY8BUG9_9MICO|nr:acyltransferase [Microbacterium sp. KACC 23027]WEG07467.1 acyltransferase [Microbacterium sp. KACC 23027]
MPALDGLRAAAVALVFVTHAFPSSAFPGGLGVDVFFVISGFLITRILLKQWREHLTIGLKRFWLTRLIRLYPPLIAMVIVFAALYAFLPSTGLHSAVNATVALTHTADVVATVTDQDLGYFAHTWSLAMEEQFYLVWPVVLLLMLQTNLRRRWMIALTVLVAGASLTGWVLTGDQLPYNPLTKAGGILLGCAAAIALEYLPTALTGQTLAWVGAAVFTAACLGESFGWFTRSVSLPIAVLGILPVVLHCATGRGSLVAALSWRPVVSLGVISYALYLWHYPVLMLLRRVVPADAWIIAVLGAAVSLALAAATRRFVEQPSLAWRRRLLARRDSPPPQKVPGTVPEAVGGRVA